MCVAVSLVISGCADMTSSPEDNRSEGGAPACRADADCPTDQACQQGICTVTRVEQKRRVGFAFVPDASSGYLPQRTGIVEVEPGERRDFVLNESVVVRGDVSMKGSTSVIDDGTLIFESRANAERLRQQAPILGDGFSVELLPGTYRVTFISAQDDLPNRIWEDVAVGESKTSLPLRLPAREEVLEIQGTLTHIDSRGGPDGPSTPPVSGARVVGVGQDGSLTTADITDEDGQYRLFAWADAGVLDLSIGPSSQNRIIPQVTESEALDTTSAQSLTPGTQLGEWPSGRLALTLEPLLGQIDKEITERAEVTWDASDFRITLRAEMGRGMLTLPLSLGAADMPILELPALDYEVTIRPPIESPLGEVSMQLSLSPTNPLPSLEVMDFPVKRRVVGEVRTADGRLIEGARVELRPLTKSDPDGTRRDASPDDDVQLLAAQTRDDGTFEVWLERSWDYEVTILPPTEATAPQGIFTINAANDDVQRETFALAPPLALFGSVMNEQWEGQPDVDVEVTEEMRGEPRVIAKSRTSNNGEFRIVLPALPPAEADGLGPGLMR